MAKAAYVFDVSGVCLEINRNTPSLPRQQDFEKRFGADITILFFDDDPHPGTREDQVSLVNGEVQLVSGQPTIYCHIDITGGDGLSPVGILNDGQSGANVTITLREGEDPASALFSAGGSLLNTTWRVPIVKGDKLTWTTVEFVDSVATGVYRTTGEPGLLQLAPERLDPVTLPDGQGGYITYGFAAVGDTEIIVSEELAAA